MLQLLRVGFNGIGLRAHVDIGTKTSSNDPIRRSQYIAYKAHDPMKMLTQLLFLKETVI